MVRVLAWVVGEPGSNIQQEFAQGFPACSVIALWGRTSMSEPPPFLRRPLSPWDREGIQTGLAHL